MNEPLVKLKYVMIYVDYLSQMRFLDNTGGSKVPSKLILDVGVQNALCLSRFDEQMFYKRGGRCVWSKGDMNFDW